MTLLIEEDGGVQIGQAKNLLQGGMRPSTQSSLETCQRVGLLLGDGSKSVISACVVWLGKNDSKQPHQAGLEFLEPLGAPV